MTQIAHFEFGNIADTPICMVFYQDGSIAQVNTETGVGVFAAASGTISEPQLDIGMAQWGSQYILMCAPQTNGYFIWDGQLFYKAGTVGPTVTITNSGFGYSSLPTITPVGGSGTGAAFVATLNSSGGLGTIKVTNPGTGYLVNDFVYLAFAGGGSTTSAIATAFVTGGQVTNVIVNNGGIGYNQSSITVTMVGGGGIGSTATATVSNGTVTAVTATSGEGYLSAPTVVFSDPGNPVAQAVVAVMPFGVQGSALETFQSRVWLVNGGAATTPPDKNIAIFSAPSDPADFSILDGAGVFRSVDSFLRVGWHAIKQSNGFLYLIGDSSVNYISGVQTTGTPPITTFSNQNVDPQIGSPWPETVEVFSRAIAFANTLGVYAMYGGAVTKVSNPLDGIYTTVAAAGETPSYQGLIPSAAVMEIFGIRCYILLLPIIDPTTNLQRNALILWDGQKWWTASQSVALVKIATQEINSVLTAWGTDGVNLYKLFQTPSDLLLKTVQSKQWDSPHYTMTKQAKDLAGLYKMNIAESTTFNVSIDTVSIGGTVASPSYTQNTGSTFAWTYSSGATFSWSYASGASFTWTGPIPAANPFIQSVDATGVLMGMTLTTHAKDMTLVSLSLIEQQYKPEWQ